MKKFSAWIFVFIISVIIVAEGILRIQSFLTLPTEQIEIKKYVQDVYVTIYKRWMDVRQQADPFSPPLLVYSNKNIDNNERLLRVFEETRLPSSKSWKSYDFIQGPEKAELTEYQIHSNSFGFRGREYSLSKPKKTYRVVVLGSYHAFGHGVNDDETYCARAEYYLNKKFSKSGIRFEVWNGGRHAGTAIVGLARMKFEIFKFAPDLIVLDYGFIDTLVWGDNVMPVAMRLPDSWTSKLVRASVAPFIPILGSSILWQNLSKKFFFEQPPERIEQFDTTLQSMLDIAAENKTPVILMRQLLSYPLKAENYRNRKNVGFIDANDVFYKNPPQYLPTSEWVKEPWSRTWMSKMNSRWTNDKTFIYYPYRLNIFQLNVAGNDVMGESLAQLIGTQFYGKKMTWQ